jgi:hypothetical protein
MRPKCPMGVVKACCYIYRVCAYSKLGWVDIGIGTKGKWRFVVSLEKNMGNSNKSFFNQFTFIAELITFRVMQYIRVQKIVFTIWA